MITKQGMAALFFMIFSSVVYADVETEPNNNKDTSDILVSGTSMTAQLSSSIDEDWFSYSITAPDVIKIIFTTKNNYYSYNWQVNVQDVDGNILSGTSISGGTVNIDVGASKAGIYYIIIVIKTSYLSDQYTLTVTSTNTSPGCIGTCTSEQLKTEYDKGYHAGITACSQGVYTQAEVDQMVKNILTWGDTNGDGKIDLTEAIHALQITSGVKQ